MYFIRGLIAFCFLSIGACITQNIRARTENYNPNFELRAKTLAENFQVSFSDAMMHSRFFNFEKAHQDTQWLMLEQWYEKAIKKSFLLSDNFIIPNNFHLIWLGSAVPERYHTLAKRLKELHPNAQVRIWTDSDVESFEFVNKKAFNHEKNYGAQSDVFRYEILNKYGGIYLDGDFELKKSLDDLLRVCSFFAGLAYNAKKIELYNGLIACTPGHPIIKECLETIKSTALATDLIDLDKIIARTGPGHFTRCVLSKGHQSPGITVAFPVAFFYPWPNYERHNKNKNAIESFIKPYSYTVHYWAASWINANAPKNSEPKISKSLVVPLNQKIIKKHTTKHIIQPAQKAPVQQKNKFVIVTLTYNNEQVCQDNMLSILDQNFPSDRYRVILINDASNDKTEENLFKVLESHPRAGIVTYVKNNKRRGGMANYIAASYMCDNDEIVIHVDGDDRLMRKDALSIVDEVYTEDIWVTYGSYVHKSDGKLGFFNAELPERVIINNQIRHYDWVTSHLRTYRAWLFRKIRIDDFMYGTNWLPCCTDLAMMWPLIEMAGEKHIKRIITPVYEYNDMSELNLYKVAREKVLEINNYLKHKKPYTPLRVL